MTYHADGTNAEKEIEEQRQRNAVAEGEAKQKKTRKTLVPFKF